MESPQEHYPALIQALMQPSFYPHEVSECQLLETHISWVILTGLYAYKVKKPVNFGFLDFSTLKKRRFYCQEELRLNQRIASTLYISVLTISKKQQQFLFNNVENPCEYVLQMHQFPQQVRFDLLMDRGLIQIGHMKKTAALMAQFHDQGVDAQNHNDYGSPLHVYQPMLENFEQLKIESHDSPVKAKLKTLANWCESTFHHLQTVLFERKQQCFIRECHGDLHLSNLAWLDESPLAFDCLEFNPDLRWIDVMSDIAFLVMDLQRCQPDNQENNLSHYFLNEYLEYRGDYKGLKVLKFYLCYRAIVMAKVEFLRIQQLTSKQKEYQQSQKNFDTYLSLANQYTQAEKPCLIITYGLSASGKSTLTTQLLQQLEAVRIRSDIERKRLCGLWPKWAVAGANKKNIYTQEMNQQTHERLLTLADSIIDAAYTVIVDATFLNQKYRKYFNNLAKTKQIPFVILSFTASIKTLRERIHNRKTSISDADLSVLEKQISELQPLSVEESAHSIRIDTEQKVDIKLLAKQIGLKSSRK